MSFTPALEFHIAWMLSLTSLIAAVSFLAPVQWGAMCVCRDEHQFGCERKLKSKTAPGPRGRRGRMCITRRVWMTVTVTELLTTLAAAFPTPPEINAASSLPLVLFCFRAWIAQALFKLTL